MRLSSSAGHELLQIGHCDAAPGIHLTIIITALFEYILNQKLIIRTSLKSINFTGSKLMLNS